MHLLRASLCLLAVLTACAEPKFEREKDDGQAKPTDSGRVSSLALLTQDTSIKAEEFVLDSAIYTFGYKLEIEAKSILSKGGRIVAFPDTPALPGLIGASAGTIKISTQEIRGSLEVDSRGQQGGQGERGAAGSVGSVGASGDSTGELFIFCKKEQIPDNQLGRLSREDWWQRYHANAGKPGGAGSEGAQGFPGYRGGDSGDIELNIPDSEKQKVRLNSSGGFGGEGGPGGLGGMGGAGGSPGRSGLGWPSNCDPIPFGQVGDRGAPGSRGPLGQSGRAGRLTINGQILSQESFP